MENLAGGFTSFREIKEDEKVLFGKCLSNLLGVGRVPLAVATQVVKGVNYAFLCDSHVIIPNPVPYNELVTIYQPLEGEPILTEIKTVKIL